MIRFQSPWVASCLAIQNPLLSVTSTWSSPGRRSGSLGGLPMINLPAGHQHTGMPTTSRGSPAFDPLKVDGTIVLVESFAVAAAPPPWAPNPPDASRTTKQNRFAKDMMLTIFNHHFILDQRLAARASPEASNFKPISPTSQFKERHQRPSHPGRIDRRARRFRDHSP